MGRRLGAASMQAKAALPRCPAVEARHLHRMIVLLDLQIGRPVGLPPRRLGLPAPGQRLCSNSMPYKPLRRKAFVFRGAWSALVRAPSSGACKLVDPLLQVSVLP